MKVAIVHDWFDKIAGSEKVVRQLIQCFPDAHVFSLVDHLNDDDRKELKLDVIHTSFVQRLPFSARMFRNYLPLMPMAIEQFDFTGYDLVLSSSHAFARSVLTTAEQLHVTYVHTPIRYAWDMQGQYLGNAGLKRGVKAAIVRAALHYIRMWDRGTANRPDVYVANSQFVANRIRKTYDRESNVIFPPVDVESMRPVTQKSEFYLAAGRLVSYKRFDLVVEAFARHPDKELIVIGNGDERSRLEAMATPNVKILGYQPDEVLLDHLQRAKAFVFAAVEDFGILPVEAQACGTPVIGFDRGGLRETVIDQRTGLLFAEQTVDCLSDAIQTMSDLPDGYFDVDAIRRHAKSFSDQRFRHEVKTLVKNEFLKRDSALADEIEVLDFDAIADMGESIESETVIAEPVRSDGTLPSIGVVQ